MLANLNRFIKNQEGSALVEFVLVLPLLLLIILTLLELGIMLAIKTSLQSAAMSGAYYGQAGNYATGSTRAASAQNIIKQSLPAFINSANLTITIQSYATFAIAYLGGAGTPGTGNPGQVGKYQVQYVYTPASPLTASIFGSTEILQGVAYGRNELTFPS